MGEDPADRYLDPGEDISIAAGVCGLRPCTISGGEESLGEAAGEEAKDTLGGVEIFSGGDSTSRVDMTED